MVSPPSSQVQVASHYYAYPLYIPVWNITQKLQYCNGLGKIIIGIVLYYYMHECIQALAACEKV